MAWWLVPFAAAAVWEACWWRRRVLRRRELYRRAKQHARAVRKPLLIVGAPDLGPTKGPIEPGDLVLDIAKSAAPNAIQADVTRIPLPDDSVVVFVSCVLEYVPDLEAAMRELRRVAGGRIYVCHVEPWTLTGAFYPGRRRVLPHSITGNGRRVVW